MIVDRASGDKPSRVVAVIVLLALSLAGCPPGEPDLGAERLEDAEEDLADQVEDGLEYQPPPPRPEDALMLDEMVLEHRQRADEVIGTAAAAMSVLAVAASMFVPEGPADLMVDMLPAGKVANALGELAKAARKIRKGRRGSKKLAAKMAEFTEALDPANREFVIAVSKMPRKASHALYKIHERTKSGKVVRELVDQYKDDPDVLVWIGDRLARGKLNEATVRRFTFDEDLIVDYTLHSTNLSWKALKETVEGAVDQASRDSLASKVVGLMGEQAAAKIAATRAFSSKYTGQAKARVRLERGVGYGGGRSMDLAVYTEHGEAVFVEVKNWSLRTWNDAAKRERLLAQLVEHDQGIQHLLAARRENRTLAAKVLMVRKEPFMDELDEEKRNAFVKEVATLGWQIDYIPAKDIPDFGDVLDALR